MPSKTSCEQVGGVFESDVFFAVERSALGLVEKGNCDEDEDVPAAAGASFNVRWRLSVRERERLSKRRAFRGGAIGGACREVPKRRRIAADGREPAASFLFAPVVSPTERSVKRLQGSHHEE